MATGDSGRDKENDRKQTSQRNISCHCTAGLVSEWVSWACYVAVRLDCDMSRSMLCKRAVHCGKTERKWESSTAHDFVTQMDFIEYNFR